MFVEGTIEQPAAAAVRTGDGRRMIGHVIVRRGLDTEGADVLAVWQIATDGSRTGAWVLPAGRVFDDPEAANRVLSLFRRRTVLDWDGGGVRLVESLECVASAAAADWRPGAVVLPEVIDEIAVIREKLSARVDEMRATNKRIVAVDWRVDIPRPLPVTAAELRARTALAVPVTSSPIVHEVLELGVLAQWAVARWRETLNLVERRRYLREELGPLAALPPSWERRLADAYG